jgi:hypothetical protein
MGENIPVTKGIHHVGCSRSHAPAWERRSDAPASRPENTGRLRPDGYPRRRVGTRKRYKGLPSLFQKHQKRSQGVA